MGAVTSRCSPSNSTVSPSRSGRITRTHSISRSLRTAGGSIAIPVAAYSCGVWPAPEAEFEAAARQPVERHRLPGQLHRVAHVVVQHERAEPDAVVAVAIAAKRRSSATGRGRRDRSTRTTSKPSSSARRADPIGSSAWSPDSWKPNRNGRLIRSPVLPAATPPTTSATTATISGTTMPTASEKSARSRSAPVWSTRIERVYLRSANRADAGAGLGDEALPDQDVGESPHDEPLEPHAEQGEHGRRRRSPPPRRR